MAEVEVLVDKVGWGWGEDYQGLLSSIVLLTIAVKIKVTIKMNMIVRKSGQPRSLPSGLGRRWNKGLMGGLGLKILGWLVRGPLIAAE